MHLIDKQDGSQAMTFQPLVGGIHLQAQIFDSSQHGIQ